MSKIMSLNEELSIEIDKTKGRTVISVLESNKRIVLSDMKTDECFWTDVRYNDYYVIAYSRGCMANQIPLSIEAVYSREEKQLLDLTSFKLKQLLEETLVLRRGFYLPVVLSLLNDSNSELCEQEEVNNFVNYLTSGNTTITKKQIRRHLILAYPVLEKYSQMKGIVSVLKYKEIERQIGSTVFWFYRMPQKLSVLKKLSKID